MVKKWRIKAIFLLHLCIVGRRLFSTLFYHLQLDNLLSSHRGLQIFLERLSASINFLQIYRDGFIKFTLFLEENTWLKHTTPMVTYLFQYLWSRTRLFPWKKKHCTELSPITSSFLAFSSTAVTYAIVMELANTLWNLVWWNYSNLLSYN